ncbi:hypothetical protein L6452_19549 [Arctium lappa]|uniref:Uncharacterized protein n=1 Tax=Arctium lappa TaxID=4217 RepID=A0ACB9B8Y8_ARCLA|nr:hypothetical protein L6452_19549 [Arctium lappa]
MLEERGNMLENENLDLTKRLAAFEKEKVDSSNERKNCARKILDLSKKVFDERKVFELQNAKLSQQVSDFEKVIILEREKFVKEKKEIEQKNVGLCKEISRHRKDVEKGFEEERSMFEAEIKKLTEKLFELSESVLKEKKTKSECETKIDLLVKERDSLASKIKELEKTASSSNQKTVSSDQISSTNLFYDRNIDGSSTHRRRRRYKEEELVWKKKPVEDEKKDELKGKKSYVQTHKAKKNNARKGLTWDSCASLNRTSMDSRKPVFPTPEVILEFTIPIISEFEKIWIYTFHELTDTQIKGRRMSNYHKGEIVSSSQRRRSKNVLKLKSFDDHDVHNHQKGGEIYKVQFQSQILNLRLKSLWIQILQLSIKDVIDSSIPYQVVSATSLFLLRAD